MIIRGILAKHPGVLSGLGNLVAGACITISLATRGQPPNTLQTVIGPWANGWAVVILISLIIPGLLALLQPRLWAMWAETVTRPVAAGFVGSYAVGAILGAGGPVPWFTVGFAFACTIDQVRRQVDLATRLIPAEKYLREEVRA